MSIPGKLILGWRGVNLARPCSRSERLTQLEQLARSQSASYVDGHYGGMPRVRALEALRDPRHGKENSLRALSNRSCAVGVSRGVLGQVCERECVSAVLFFCFIPSN